MAQVLGSPELIEDPRFIRNGDRLWNKEALGAIIEPAFRSAWSTPLTWPYPIRREPPSKLWATPSN
ncbi:hypothetical protein GCM10027580_22380 [Corynebacterium faecale]|uniref:hypothetical protein n=1 Tax=Corynebacterium faecale TaxID=1758466 RepID=UPI0025B62485|nr:hypothetical protein [Corynebacterium faecale]